MATIYRYADHEYTHDELREAVEIEAAGLPPEQWLGGRFDFPAWLVDSLLTGTVEKVDAPL